MISIVVCAYNEEQNIYNCLASLAESVKGHQDVEVIVVDNSSRDGTFEIAQKSRQLFNCKYKLISIKHVPLSISRNTGMSVSDGDYVIYVDADAVVDSSWFTFFKDSIKSSEEIVFSGKVKNLVQDENDSSELYYKMLIAPSEDSKGSKLIGANMGFKKTCLEEIGGFSRITKYRGDEVFVLRKIQKRFGLNIEKNCEGSIVYNQFPDTIKSMFKTSWVEGLSYARILFSLGPTRFELVYRGTILAILILAALSFFSFQFQLFFLLVLVRLLIRIKFFKVSFVKCMGLSKNSALASIPLNILNTLLFDVSFYISVVKSLFGNLRKDLTDRVEVSEILKTG